MNAECDTTGVCSCDLPLSPLRVPDVLSASGG